LIRERAKGLSYGWGVIHIHGEIQGIEFETAVIPKEKLYYIPIKDAIRKPLELEIGDSIKIQFNLGRR